MEFKFFWKPQDRINERARVGFWFRMRNRRVVLALTWYKGPCFLRCFVFKRSRPPFQCALALSTDSVQVKLDYDAFGSTYTGPAYGG